MDGILNINKPAGRTSFSVVAQVKRLTKEKHAGHAGTLDPEASGVLPVCLGKATRIIEFMMETHKMYRAVIEMGITTDSYDGAGKVLKKRDPSCITKDILEMALSSFKGTIQQTPPMFSALKHQGQPLYTLAREGIEIERKSRPVTIYKIEMLEFKPPLVTLDIECSKGTYIRSIANDLGEVTGFGAYLKNLVRTGYGPFKLEDAVTPEALEEAVKRGGITPYLHSADSVLEHLPSIILDEAGEEAIKKGQMLVDKIQDTGDKRQETGDKIQETRYNDQGPADFSPNEMTRDNESPAKYGRAYSGDGRFLGILVKDKECGAWRPKKVFI